MSEISELQGYTVPRHLSHIGIIQPGNECIGCPEFALNSFGTSACMKCVLHAPLEVQNSIVILRENNVKLMLEQKIILSKSELLTCN